MSSKDDKLKDVTASKPDSTKQPDKPAAASTEKKDAKAPVKKEEPVKPTAASASLDKKEGAKPSAAGGSSLPGDKPAAAGTKPVAGTSDKAKPAEPEKKNLSSKDGPGSRATSKDPPKKDTAQKSDPAPAFGGMGRGSGFDPLGSASMGGGRKMFDPLGDSGKPKPPAETKPEKKPEPKPDPMKKPATKPEEKKVEKKEDPPKKVDKPADKPADKPKEAPKVEKKAELKPALASTEEKKEAAKPDAKDPAKKVEVPISKPSTAATAVSDKKPDPLASKTDPVKKPEPAKPGPAKPEPSKPEPAKKVEEKKAEAVKSDASKSSTTVKADPKPMNPIKEAPKTEEKKEPAKASTSAPSKPATAATSKPGTAAPSKPEEKKAADTGNKAKEPEPPKKVEEKKAADKAPTDKSPVKPTAPPTKPSEKPAGKPLEKVAEKPVSKPGDKPVEKPADKLPSKPAEKPIESQIKKPAEVAKPAEKKPEPSKPAAKPSAEKPGAAIEKPGAKPGDKLGDKAVEKPGVQAGAKPGDKPGDKPSASKPSGPSNPAPKKDDVIPPPIQADSSRLINDSKVKGIRDNNNTVEEIHQRLDLKEKIGKTIPPGSQHANKDSVVGLSSRISPRSSQAVRKSVKFEDQKKEEKQDPKKMSPSAKPAPAPSGSSPRMESVLKKPSAAEQKKEEPKEDPPNKYSLKTVEQAQRLQSWLTNMRLFKPFNCERLPPPRHRQSKIICVRLQTIEPTFQIPNEFKDDAAYAYDLQFGFTLTDPTVGLFGRTCVMKSERGPVAAADLRLDGSQYVMLHSDLDFSRTYLLCEVLVNVYNKNEDNRLETTLGLGLLVIKLTTGDADPAGTKKEMLYNATPRNFIIFQDDQTVPSKIKHLDLAKPETQVEVTVQEMPKSNSGVQFMKFVPDNTIVCRSDIVPGLKEDRLPLFFTEKVIDDMLFSTSSTVWAHNVEFDNLSKIDTLFNKFLIKHVAPSGFSAEIVKRRLTCTSSNSCYLSAISSTSVDLKARESKREGTFKVENPKGSVRIEGIPSNRLSCLVFRIVYKVRYQAHGSKEMFREFVLGRNPYFLNFDFQSNSGFVRDRLVEFPLSKCPELNFINDLMWESGGKALKNEELTIKVRMTLSNSQDLKSEQQIQELEKKFIENEVSKQKRKELEKENPEAQLDEETIQRMARMQIENDKLSKQNQVLMEQLADAEKAKIVAAEDAKKEAEELERLRKEEEAKKVADDHAEKEKQKAEDEEKKESDDKNMKQLQKDYMEERQKEMDVNKQARMVDVLFNREDVDVLKLMELLHKLIVKMQEQPGFKEVVDRLQNQILKLLENDISSQLTFFGASGRFKALHFNNLPDADKKAILSSCGGDGSSREGGLDFSKFKYKPSIDVELKDQFRASKLTIKFVAFKTPKQINRSVCMPQRTFFTLKFYTFAKAETEQVLLRLPRHMAKNIKEQANVQNAVADSEMAKPQGQLLEGKQYFLMKFGPSKQSKDQFKDMWAAKQGGTATQEQVEAANNLEVTFDFDPTAFIDSKTAEDLKAAEEQEKKEHEIFSRFMNERVLTIDMWNGDTLMHFGSCKIPLALLLRQGEPSKTIGQEFEVMEPQNAEAVGDLQLVIQNVGRQIRKEPTRPDSPPKHDSYKMKKSVVSHPINTEEVQETLQEKLLKTQIDSNIHSNLQLDEEQRKLMRIQRLRQRKLAENIDVSKLNVKGASDWEKQEQLKQIAILREQKKQQLLSQISLTAAVQNQKRLDVCSGEPYLIELETNNPYSKKQTFTVSIDDHDFRMGYLAKPELVMVDNSHSEWAHWHSKGLCGKPSDPTIASASKMEVTLTPGQRCVLLFKFQSFREPVIDSSGRPQKEEEKYLELRPRSVKIEVLNKDGFSIQSMGVNIQPRTMICDQEFRFYEPATKQARVGVPNFIKNSLDPLDIVMPLHLCTMVCSNKDILIETTGEDTMEVVIEAINATAVKRAFLFIYKDEFCSEPLGSCKIELNFLTLVQLKVNAGEEYEYPITILNPAQPDGEIKQRTVEIFSSDPQLVFPPHGKKRNLVQLKASNRVPQKIQLGINCISQGTFHTRVNCVDINSRTAIETYLVEVTAEKPAVNQVKKVPCRVGQDNFCQLPFRNPVSESDMIFELASSNPKVVQPQHDKLHFKAKEGKQLRFFLPHQKQAGTYEVVLSLNGVQQGLENKELAEGQEPIQHSENILFRVEVA